MGNSSVSGRIGRIVCRMLAKILEKREVADGTLQVKFSVPGLPTERLAFQPGQYFTIRLSNPPYHDNRGAVRHFTIVNSPNEKGILSFTTRLRDSAFKKSIVGFPVGTEVEVGSIGGNFVLPEDNSKPLVFTAEGRKLCFIAGGIGITPFMSMLQYSKEEGLGYQFTLLYSNKNQAGTAFLDELQKLASPEVVWRGGFKLVLTMTEDPGWAGEKRRIDAQFIKDYTGDLPDPLYYVAGPPAMTDAIVDSLKELKVESSRIKYENFTGY